jgi:diguanylate cyclase (GGDEF)-like protein
VGSTRVTGGSAAFPGTGPIGVPTQSGPDRALARRVPSAAVEVPAGVPVLWQWDAPTGRTTAAARVYRALGLPPGGPLTLAAVRRLVHPDDVERFDDLVLGLAACRGAVQETVRFVGPDGAVRPLSAWAAVRAVDQEIVGAFGGLLDGDGREALRAGQTALHAVEELTGVGLWEWDPATGELLWSAPMYALLGVAPGAVRPTVDLWREAVHPDDRQAAARLDVGAPGRAGGHLETLRVVGHDGVLRWVTCWSAADGAGSLVHGAAVEVSRQVRDRVRLRELSSMDAVTGLLNRQGLARRLRQRLDAGGEVGLVLLDLDRFKVVNDTLGHHLGDALLVEVSRRLTALVPEGGTVARMGGDEFAVLAPPSLGRAELGGLAEALVGALRAPYLLAGALEPLSCSASAGVTARGGRPVGGQELLAEADLALSRAKDRGRSRHVLFDDELRARASARHSAERTLRNALDGGRLVLRYQPVVDLATGRRVGAEALVRIRDESDPTGRRLSLPEMFIDVAEETGLVVQLDRWVVDQALDQLAHWCATGPAERVPWLAVNVSPLSMAQPDVVPRLLDGLAGRGLPPSLLKVELTERSFLGADPAGEAALRRLIDSGVRVGIDDFGTGYSALAYLQRFDLDFMKIDRSFVAAVGAQGRADAVVTALVDLAHAHGMQVTAEGIEHPRQAARLRQIGCDLAQGFHFGRPGSACALDGAPA